MLPPPDIRDLGVIGDRRTAALVTRLGDVVWYCPGRFDADPLLRALIDPERGAAWRLEGALRPGARGYLDESGVLQTTVQTAGGEVTLVDFMPYGESLPQGVCRLVRAGSGATLVLTVSDDAPAPQLADVQGHSGVELGDGCWLTGSHPLKVEGRTVRLQVPAGASGWALLGPRLDSPADPEGWLETSLDAWRTVGAEAQYTGPYEQAMRDSLRALRLLTFQETSSVVAAPTTSLPEVPGKDRNYDYRYVWFRDAGMIVRALSRLTRTGTLGRGFLDFIRRYAAGRPPEEALPPLATVTRQDAPSVSERPYAGFQGSCPVRFGNEAVGQLQLDVYGNIMLASAQLYTQQELAEHWPVLEPLVTYYCAHWPDPDNGIWEEAEQLPYVSSKVLGAAGLEALAPLHPDPAIRGLWEATAREIRGWMAQQGLTNDGAFAAVAGEEAVDVVAALYSAWNYCPPDAPEMLVTLDRLEREHFRDGLYWRTLRQENTEEGAFLAGTLWVGMYWAQREPERARKLLEAVLSYANDLGLLSEQADTSTGALIGNFPQTFVHSAVIALIDELGEGTTEQE